MYGQQCSQCSRAKLAYACVRLVQEMAPIIYTPTVGWVCTNYHKLYRNPRGMYFSATDRGDMVCDESVYTPNAYRNQDQHAAGGLIRWLFRGCVGVHTTRRQAYF